MSDHVDYRYLTPQEVLDGMDVVRDYPYDEDEGMELEEDVEE